MIRKYLITVTKDANINNLKEELNRLDNNIVINTYSNIQVILIESKLSILEIANIEGIETVEDNDYSTNEDEESLKYYVDIPDSVRMAEGEHNPPLLNLAVFDTREEAIKYAQEALGADEKGRICVVSGG